VLNMCMEAGERRLSSLFRLFPSSLTRSLTYFTAFTSRWFPLSFFFSLSLFPSSSSSPPPPLSPLLKKPIEVLIPKPLRLNSPFPGSWSIS